MAGKKWVEVSDYRCGYCGRDFVGRRKCCSGVPDERSPAGTAHMVCPRCGNFIGREAARNTEIVVEGTD